MIFVVQEETIQRDHLKLPVRTARIIIDFRESTDTKLSDGVQQFLHARLNAEYGSTGLPFIIEPEKTYLASKSSKNFADYYIRQTQNSARRGDIIGLTGTLGSVAERQELQKTYGAKLYKLPPRKALARSDNGIFIARKSFLTRHITPQQRHFKLICEHVETAYLNNLPILIINQNANIAKDLHAYLAKHLVFSARTSLSLFT